VVSYCLIICKTETSEIVILQKSKEQNGQNICFLCILKRNWGKTRKTGNINHWKFLTLLVAFVEKLNIER